MNSSMKRKILTIIGLLLMSVAIALRLYRDGRTVLAGMWTTVAVLHGLRLGILMWKNRENRKDTGEE